MCFNITSFGSKRRIKVKRAKYVGMDKSTLLKWTIITSYILVLRPGDIQWLCTWTRRGGRWSKKSLFLSTFRVENVHVEIGGVVKKKAKLCPRSHWMPPTLENRLFMFIVYAFESDLFDDFIIFKLLVARQPKSMNWIQTIFSKKSSNHTGIYYVPL